MKCNQRRMRLACGTLAGSLFAAAFLPMAVAFADQYDFTPDPTTFVPTQVEGYPPLINEVTGTEDWGINDLTTNTTAFGADDFTGTDTETTIGSFTNNDYLTSTAFIAGNFVMAGTTQVDLANFGDGWGNEWIDVPSGTDPGISDLLITPFGDFQLLGSFFSDLATALG